MKFLSSLFSVLHHPHNRGKLWSTLLRVAWWKMNMIFFRYKLVYPLAENAVCVCPPSSSYAGLLMYVHRPEPEVSSFIEKYIGKGEIFFDVGANIGAISLLAASRGAKVWSFEPNEGVRADLIMNVALNSWQDRIKVFSEIVSLKKGYAQFSNTNESEISHLSHTGEKGIRLKTTSLLEVCKAEKIKRIDVLKVDVEGAEMMVLSGAQELLQNKKIECLVLELNTENTIYGTSHQEIFTYLQGFGYQFYSLEPRSAIKLSEAPDQSKTWNVIALHDKRTLSRVRKAWLSK